MRAAERPDLTAAWELDGPLPRHVWLVDEATNSRKPPLIALLLELRRIENDGPAHSRAAELH